MPAESPLRDRLGPGDGLIETMGYVPGEGIVRLERHLGRMAGSAKAFGIGFEPGEARALASDRARGPAPLRLRLALASDGGLTVAAAPFAPTPRDAVWTLAIAETRLDSRDPLLTHKTTRRGVYERARAEFAAGDAQEVLLLNERGEVCEGTITSLFVARGDGVLLTPPLSCGLLEGVLRAEMIASGRCLEQTFSLAELLRAPAVYVGNSLRGLIAARLQPASASLL